MKSDTETFQDKQTEVIRAPQMTPSGNTALIKHSEKVKRYYLLSLLKQ